MEEVRNWLRGFGLEDYADKFDEDGWDTLEVVLHMNEEDINCCIDKPGHRKRFQLALSKNANQQICSTQRNIRSARDRYNQDAQADNDSTNSPPKEDEVKEWLTHIGLNQYAEKFNDDGWDTIEVLLHMNEEDIKTCINKPGHRKRFQLDFQKLVADDAHEDGATSEGILPYTKSMCVKKGLENVEELLKRFELDQYTTDFEKDGWDTLEVIFHMDEEDIQRCISKPGHRKRFHLALTKHSRNIMTSNRATHTTDKDLSSDRDKLSLGRETTYKCAKVDIYRQSFNQTTDDDERLNHSMKTISDSPVDLSDLTRDHFEEQNKRLKVICKTPTPTEKKSEKDEATTRKEVNSLSSDGAMEDILQVTSIQINVESEAQENASDIDKQTQIEAGAHKIQNINTDIDKVLYEDSDDDGIFKDAYEDTRKHLLSQISVEDRQRNNGDVTRVVSSPPIIPSTTIIKPRHCSIGATFEKYKLIQEDKSQRNNFKQQMQTSLRTAREKDILYVETRAFEELVHIVDDRHWAVIIGVPGDGKSAMAAHLSLKYNEKGYEHLELHFARDWKDWVDGSSGKVKGKKQFVLIDDIFGRMTVDEIRVSGWSSIIDLMERVVKQRQGDLVVVCTSRKYVYMDVKTKLAKFLTFQDSSIVDMTLVGLALTRREKLKIWKNYALTYDVNTDMPECINQDTNTPHGFPHCVELFSTNRFLQNEGVSFFENPMKYVCMEIENFIENDRIKYFALLLVLFHNNKLGRNFLEQMSFQSEDVKRIFNAAGLSTPPTKVDLKLALNGLKNTYITELDRYFSFSHDSMRENLAYMFIKENPVHAIEDIDFNYLTDHTRTHGQKLDGKKNIFVLPHEYNANLAKRMIAEIRNGNVVTVCAHRAWNDNCYIEELLHFVLQSSQSDDSDVGLHKLADQGSIADIFRTKDSAAFDFNLFDALRFFGHGDAVRQLLECEELSKQLQDVVEIPRSIRCVGPLSLHLYRLMDDTGASTKVREFQKKSAVVMEILDTFSSNLAEQAFSCYIFGSHSEGTRIPTHITKLETDVNYVFCVDDYDVIQDISEAKMTKSPQLLTIIDDMTKPGYVKLQLIRNGVPQTAATVKDELPEHTVLDYKNRVVVHRKRPDKIHVDENVGSKTTTSIITGNQFDICYSYRCRMWPDFAKKWATKDRHYNWPTRYALEQMKSLGFFLVPVGCRGSNEKHLEWKMSFLLQERMLMSSLNETQYKCYIVLKMINNDIISYFIKEPALVSYHLKTCMFTLIENTPNETWMPANLLECVQGCLKCILKWAVNGECPNYFIPEENMFAGRIHGELQIKLWNILRKLLSSDFKYFLHIKCGNLGPSLEQAIIGQSGKVTVEQILAPDICLLNIKAVSFICLVKNRILYKCSKQTLEPCISGLWNTMSVLRKTKTITDHSKKRTEKSIAFVLPYIELSLISTLVALTTKTLEEVKQEQVKDILLSKMWLEISISSNLFSSTLKQATFLYMLGYSNVSLEILKRLNTLLCPLAVSVCGCSGSHYYSVDENTKVKLNKIPGTDIRTKYCMPCIAFLPTEREIIPTVLAKEMDRSYEMPPRGENEPYQFWYDWAVVDSKILFFFLLYLNHVRLNMTDEVSHDVKNLGDVLRTDPNLGHKETGFNILGWIYRQEGNEQNAEESFQRSISVQRIYNAAYLQMKQCS